jgi:hypothetical protein
MPDNGNANLPDWMHLQRIGDFINKVGFPIAMACALAVIVWRGTSALNTLAVSVNDFRGEHAEIARSSYAEAVAVNGLVNYFRGKDGLPPMPDPPQPRNIENGTPPPVAGTP